jgi:membrane protease YdiL (CAAX protease family)
VDFKLNSLIKFLPSVLYFGLCAIILTFDFGIWVPGSLSYPQFYIIPVVFSIIFLIILIILLKIVYANKRLTELEGNVDIRPMFLLLIIYMAVIWIPRQLMIWRFGVTYEKIPMLYLIITQIVLVEGILLSEFGLTKEFFLRNILLGCLVAFVDLSLMTLVNILLPIMIIGSGVLLNIGFPDMIQLFTSPWQIIAVGISEELFFRGYFFTKMRRSGKSFLFSTFLTSLFFSIFHIPWLINVDFTLNLYFPFIINRIVNNFFFGFIMCILYEKTMSLTAPIVFHGFSNSISTFISVNFEQTLTYSLLLSIIGTFNLIFIALIAPKICKLLKLEKEGESITLI